MKTLSLRIGTAALSLSAAVSAQTDLGPLNLPTQATTLPLVEDFETAAGVIPPYMALTNLDVATLSADPEAWCNIGQVAACISPYRGSFCLEMGLDPNSTNYHDVRNTMVMLIDPAGYTGIKSLSYVAHQWGDETDTVDGVWISSDGTNWYQLDGPWNKYSSDGTWTASGEQDLTSTPVDTNSPFYIAFCQEDNFPYQDLDGVGIDEIKIPGDPFTVDLGQLSLPTGFIALPWKEGFELFPGTVAPYMAVNSLDITNNLPSDPEGFCNVGQLAPSLDPFSGVYNLEMGLATGAAFHEGRQVFVIGFDGSSYTGDKTISWIGKNLGEETDTVDGVWISENGQDWFEIQQGWSGSIDQWEYSGVKSYISSSVNTDGQFYIAFCQQDDGVFDTGADGYAIDEISIPAAPFLEVDRLNAGLFSTMRVDSGYSNRVCKFLASRVGGGPTVIQGVELSLSLPIIQLADVQTDASGTALYSFVIPSALAGQTVWLQSVIITPGLGAVSNSFSGVVL